MRQFLLPSLEHVYALRKIFNIEMGQGHMLNLNESFYYKFNVKNKSWGSQNLDWQNNDTHSLKIFLTTFSRLGVQKFYNLVIQISKNEGGKLEGG